MKRLRFPRGMAARIGLAVLVTAGVAVAVVAVGVTLVSGAAFAQLMMQHGPTAAEAHAMFDQSVSVVLAAAIVLAIVVAVCLALLMASRLARPLRGLGQAARRIARGDYATATSIVEPWAQKLNLKDITAWEPPTPRP